MDVICFDLICVIAGAFGVRKLEYQEVIISVSWFIREGYRLWRQSLLLVSIIVFPF